MTNNAGMFLSMHPLNLLSPSHALTHKSCCSEALILYLDFGILDGVVGLVELLLEGQAGDAVGTVRHQQHRELELSNCLTSIQNNPSQTSISEINFCLATYS